jgi:hypothetical protein
MIDILDTDEDVEGTIHTTKDSVETTAGSILDEEN